MLTRVNVQASLFLQLTTNILWCYVVLSYIAFPIIGISFQFLVERPTFRVVCGPYPYRAREEHAVCQQIYMLNSFYDVIISDFLFKRGIVYPVSLYKFNVNTPQSASFSYSLTSDYNLVLQHITSVLCKRRLSSNTWLGSRPPDLPARPTFTG